MGDLKAFVVLEPDENTGAIVFARSNIHARRYGADEYNDGELRGMTVKRAREYDQFVETGVPVEWLVSDGWRFECCGCGLEMTEDKMLERDLPLSGIVGTQDSMCFCSKDCQQDHTQWKEVCERAGREMITKLREHVLHLLGAVIFVDDGHHNNYYVTGNRTTPHISNAHIRFRFPGQTLAPAIVEYRTTNRGPSKPTFRVCAGDKDVFQSWVDQRRAERMHAHNG